MENLLNYSQKSSRLTLKVYRSKIFLSYLMANVKVCTIWVGYLWVQLGGISENGKASIGYNPVGFSQSNKQVTANKYSK